MPTVTQIYPNLAQPPVGGYVSLPRMVIDHNDGKLYLNDNEVSNDRLNHVILLGAVRQRIMWAPFAQRETEAGGVQCESRDYEHGTPTDKFPWPESNFDYDPVGEQTLNCGFCRFKDWHAAPTGRGRSEPARCTAQVVVPILVPINAIISTMWTSDNELTADYMLTTMNFQRSSIKAIEKHIEEARLDKSPFYAKTFSMRLRVAVGDEYKYTVPELRKENQLNVHVQAYPELSRILSETRSMLTRPRPVAPPVASSFFGVSPDASAVASGYSGAFFS